MELATDWKKIIKQVRTLPERPADGGLVYESLVPPIIFPGGRRRNQFRRGHRSPTVLSEVLHELSTASHSKERKRSPKEFILTGFPFHDNLQSGPKDSYTNPPSAGRSGGVLIDSIKSL